MVSLRKAATLFVTLAVVASWVASGIFIAKDENEDYPEGYSGLVGEYASIAELKNEKAIGKISLFVYYTLIKDNIIGNIKQDMQFTTLKYMRTTGSILKNKAGTSELVFGGMANLTTLDGGYVTLFIDNDGTAMITTRIRGDNVSDTHTNNNNDEESALENEEKNANNDNNNDDDDNKLRVVSYNIWNYNGDWKKRIELLGDEICSTEYDAVALQELRYESWGDEGSMGRLQIAHLIKECQSRGVTLNYIWQPAMLYHHNINSKHVYEIEGVGILTRHPVVGVERKFLARSAWDSQDGHQRVVLAARIRPNSGKEFTFMSTHFSLSDTMETSNAHEMAEFAENLAAEKWPGPVIVMGDFNAEPSSDAYAYITGEAGFTDAWTAAAKRDGPENGFSWARVPGDPTTKRVDYCFYKNFGTTVEVAPAVATVPSEFHCVQNEEEKVGEVEEIVMVDEQLQPQQKPSRVCASDHLPVSVEFAITETDTESSSSSSSATEDVDNTKEEL